MLDSFYPYTPTLLRNLIILSYYFEEYFAIRNIGLGDFILFSKVL
nr:MAG TPA: hypothetical protein [Caudoviricetes sp.]